MYKNYNAIECRRLACIQPNLWRIMKLSFLICLLACMYLFIKKQLAIFYQRAYC